jgi:hypothetical protein
MPPPSGLKSVEFRAFLERHDIPDDERYIWD